MESCKKSPKGVNVHGMNLVNMQDCDIAECWVLLSILVYICNGASQ